jgi:hypothetical protein
MISTSIIVLCHVDLFLCCLVGIKHDSAGSRIDVVSIVLLEVENILLVTNLVMHTNSNNILPIIITNRIYDNQNL